MFFERIGRFATRYRIPIIIAWIAAAVIVTLVAPNIEDVASSDTADFLPSNAPYEHAEEVYKSYVSQRYVHQQHRDRDRCTRNRWRHSEPGCRHVRGTD